MTTGEYGELRVTATRGRVYEDDPVVPLRARIERADRTVMFPADLVDQQHREYIERDGVLLVVSGGNYAVTYRVGEYLAQQDAYVCRRVD